MRLIRAPHRALIALQGPMAEAVLARHAPEAAAMTFMTAASLKVAGIPAHVSRSGYTGEDGYEISVHQDRAAELWDLLLADERVKPVIASARATRCGWRRASASTATTSTPRPPRSRAR